MNTFKTLTLASTLVVMAASAAFAGPAIGPENEAQYQVSAQESLVPQVKHNAASQAQPAGSLDAHWGGSIDGTDR